jgi:hypothetical protein
MKIGDKVLWGGEQYEITEGPCLGRVRIERDTNRGSVSIWQPVEHLTPLTR